MRNQQNHLLAVLLAFSTSAQKGGAYEHDASRFFPPFQEQQILAGSDHPISVDSIGEESVRFHLRVTSKPSHPHLALDVPRIDGYAMHGQEAPSTPMFISPSRKKPICENAHFMFNMSNKASEGGMPGFLSTAIRLPEINGRAENETLTLPYVEIKEPFGSKTVKLGIFERKIGPEYVPAQLLIDEDERLVHPDRKIQWLACHTGLSTQANPIDLIHVGTGRGEPTSEYCKAYTPIQISMEAIDDMV